MTYPTQKGERCQRCQGTGFVPGDPEGAPTEGCDDCRGTGIQKGEREEALLPCPFCGGDAEIVHIEEGENAGGSCVCCKRCNASSNVEFEFKENFISNWNRRSSSKAEGEMREALEWQPIDTAPQGEDVLIAVFRDDFEDPIIQNSILIDGEEKGLYWSDWHGMPDPTHWMRYPAVDTAANSLAAIEKATKP